MKNPPTLLTLAFEDTVMYVFITEMSTDPYGATTWQMLDGSASRRKLTGLAPQSYGGWRGRRLWGIAARGRRCRLRCSLAHRQQRDPGLGHG